MTVRIIPRLDIKGPNLVKGIHLEGLRVLGKPERFARHYYENGADELFFMDAVASLYGRNSLVDIVAKTSREVFIPLTVGGGLRSTEDIRTILKAGADKVAINTAALLNPDLIHQAAMRFGSSTVVVGIDAIRRPDGTYEAFADYGRESTGKDVIAWAIQSVELGAGELLVTSVDRDGTGKGYDVDLIRRIAEAVPVPVIASGGAGSVLHVLDVVKDGRADAVGIASLLHYHCRNSFGNVDDYSREGNTEFLQGNKGFAPIQDVGLADLKDYLIRQGISCRPVERGAA